MPDDKQLVQTRSMWVIVITGIVIVITVAIATFKVLFYMDYVLAVLLGNSSSIYPLVSLAMVLAITFTGGFIVWAHKWNVFRVKGSWPEHMFRNPIGLGIVIGGVCAIYLIGLVLVLKCLEVPIR